MKTVFASALIALAAACGPATPVPDRFCAESFCLQSFFEERAVLASALEIPLDA